MLNIGQAENIDKIIIERKVLPERIYKRTHCSQSQMQCQKSINLLTKCRKNGNTQKVMTEKKHLKGMKRKKFGKSSTSLMADN